MAIIASKIAQIRQAIFGKDVRESLASGLEAVNDEVESTTSKQEHLEDTFNQLVINAGNSNAEIVDARVDNTTGKSYDKVGDRLDEVSAHMEDITKFKLIADINGTEYTTGKSVDYSYIRNRHEFLYGQFYRKLLTGLATQICCMGDSMTNGQDTVSVDKRIATADTTRVVGEAHSNQTIASTTYPEAMQSNLQSIYGTQVTVINRGYSGDWVKAGYEHYPNKHNSDLTVIMYGTNDSRASYVPADIRGNLDAYINWYEQLIIREILWGKAVIILTPPKLQTPSDVDIKTFAIALNALGEKYGIPVIDSTEFTANYPSTIYSDSVHFNANGYKVFASKVTALFVGEGAKKPTNINDGEILLTRPTIDNIQYFGGALFLPQGGSVQTPAESSTGTGVTATWTGTNKGIIYSFYAETNDLMIIPMYYSTTGNIRVTLDFNTVSPQNSNDLLVDYPVALTEVLPKQVVYSTPTIPALSDFIKATGSSQPTLVRVAEKGWHTLTIDCTDDSATVVFNSLYFMNYRNYKQQKDIYKAQNDIISLQQRNGYLVKYTHASASDNSTITSSTVTIAELNTVLNNILIATEYYKNPAMKLVVTNYDQSVIEYGFTIPQFSGGSAGTFSWWLIGRHNIATTPVERSVDTMTFDKTNNVININWTGATNRLTSFVIKPL